MWQQKVSLVILEADPDIAGAVSSCLILCIKPVLVLAHSWENTDGIRGIRLEGNIVLLTMLRQPVSGKPGAGEPSCSCHCSPMDMGHIQLWALGTGEVGWRDSVASRAEGPRLYLCSDGFADQCVHPTLLPLWPQLWCLAPLMVTPYHPAVWGSTSPLWLGTISSIPCSSCLWAMGLAHAGQNPAFPPVEGTFTAFLPLDLLSFLSSLFPPTFWNRNIIWKTGGEEGGCVALPALCQGK